MAMLTRLTSGGAAVAATAPGSPKALQRFHKCIAFLWPSMQTQRTQQKSMQLDAIDCFTNELVHQKSKKWETLRDTLLRRTKDETAADPPPAPSFTQTVGLISKGIAQDLNTLRSPQLGLDIRSLSQAQLDNLLLSTLEIKNKVDFLYLIRQCIRWQQLPSHEVLVACLKYLSTMSRSQQIDDFAEICRKRRHPLSEIYADLAPFKAIALWRSGGADIALRTLHRGYATCTKTDAGRRMIRNAFRTIVEETLAQKSEAVLVALMEVARAIHTDQKDIFVIACVWKQCFLSSWFCDQKSAADLLEHYSELQDLVARRSNSLCASFLSRRNVDAVHRLIEAFLQYKQRDACIACLSLLFNFQYLQKDLRACAEIVKSCSELEMPLSEIQNEQFLSLFLNQTAPKAGGTGRATVPPKLKEPCQEFQYKF